jgi:ornithine cyclodeaminase/alanine dehydrogenase-like protein (mu-crystallin family)
MTLVLSNEEIGELLTMPDCLSRLEEAYRDLADGRAVTRPRSDLYGPEDDPNQHYVFKTMDGLSPRHGVAAARLNSDVIRWHAGSAGIRKDKRPVAGAGRWVGIVILFSMQNAEPLAIMPDGVIQRMRVGATNGLAARYLAPPDASVYGLLGSGWQAGSQAMAMVAVRPIREMRVYSPTRANRERFAAEMTDLLGIEVRPVDDPRAAVQEADIVGMATDSITPVAQADWVAPHAHVSCIKELELGEGILERAARVVVHTRQGRPANYLVGHGQEPIFAHDPHQALGGTLQDARRSHPTPTSPVDLERQPDLAELVTGQVPRPASGALTCFVNTMGVGLQFAVIGSLAYERARERGVGREVPTEWLLESVHP